jgi:hypothetical protein
MLTRLFFVALGVLLASAAVAWWLTQRASATYPAVAVRSFDAAIPGGPFVQGRPLPGTPLDELGYSALADMRAAVIVSSKRPPTPDPYDNDLTLRVLLLPSDAQARRLDGAERGDPVQTRLPGSQEITVTGLEAVAWGRRSGPPVIVVAQVRRGNYVFRYSGRLHSDGFYPTEQAFLDDVKRIDAHAIQTLEAAR